MKIIEKVCVLCGRDCSDCDRARDQTGDYYCWNCYQDLTTGQQTNRLLSFVSQNHPSIMAKDIVTTATTESTSGKPLTEETAVPKNGPGRPPQRQPVKLGTVTPDDTDSLLVGGPPWERRGVLGAPRAFFKTLDALLRHPIRTFAQMDRDSGLSSPISFYLIATILSLTVAFSCTNILIGLWQDGAVQGTDRQTALSYLLLTLLFVPAIFLLTRFVLAGLFHLLLRMLGRSELSYETTFRVLAYTGGFITLAGLVPFFGSFFALYGASVWLEDASQWQWLPIAGIGGVGIWYLALVVAGFSQAHQIRPLTAFTVLLVPVLVCGGGAMALWQAI